MSNIEPAAPEKESVFKRSRALEYIGSRANFAGMGFGAIGLIAGADLIHRPLPALGITFLTYGAGYLLGKDYSKDVTFDLTTHSDRVEVHSIQRSLSDLRVQIERQRSRLPKSITAKLDTTFGLIEDILPRWSQLASFTEQKYTVNTIVTDYLPTIVANYLNLPASYYHNAAKKQFGTEVENQLTLLNNSLEQVREDIFANVERNIKVQGTFLKNKFADSNGDLLELGK